MIAVMYIVAFALFGFKGVIILAVIHWVLRREYAPKK